VRSFATAESQGGREGGREGGEEDRIVYGRVVALKARLGLMKRDVMGDALPSPCDTSVVFIAWRTLDGSGNATTAVHASVPTGVVVITAVVVSLLPPAATCFEFTPMRHEESSKLKEPRALGRARARGILICDHHLYNVAHPLRGVCFVRRLSTSRNC